MKTASVFLLVHSPLVGPFTWSRVGEELQARGYQVVVPTLTVDAAIDPPCWKQSVVSVARFLAKVPLDHSLVVVGHSGAGPLLPAICQEVNRSVSAYVFVDASIPRDLASNLDLIESESPEMAERFRRLLASGGRFPTWTGAELREVIPDEGLRRQVLAELHPMPVRYFEEPIPVFSGWPDAPCAYLRLSPAYLAPAREARRLGWPVKEMDAGHFHLVVDPSTVAGTLLELVES
jgi:hypothetical protein